MSGDALQRDPLGDDAPSGVTAVAVICGPTAAGKSALAMRLAERLGLAIISADSRQVYRGFDVGTAKPTAAERSRVRHFGIDVADPSERYSAARWATSFDAWADTARALGSEPLVVGGTGLYLRALSAPLFAEPPLDPARRARLAEELEQLPSERLRAWVTALDPARASLGRTQLLRAAEVALLTGKRISDLHAKSARPPRHALRYLIVDPGRDRLRDRIAARVDAMLAGGWLEEVRALIATVPGDAPAWNGTGYDAVRRVVTGALPLATARERIFVDTWQYAKRQRTWFRHQLADADVTSLDPDRLDADDVVEAWWRGAHSRSALS